MGSDEKIRLTQASGSFLGEKLAENKDARSARWNLLKIRERYVKRISNTVEGKQKNLNSTFNEGVMLRQSEIPHQTCLSTDKPIKVRKSEDTESDNPAPDVALEVLASNMSGLASNMSSLSTSADEDTDFLRKEDGGNLSESMLDYLATNAEWNDLVIKQTMRELSPPSSFQIRLFDALSYKKRQRQRLEEEETAAVLATISERNDDVVMFERVELEATRIDEQTILIVDFDEIDDLRTSENPVTFKDPATLGNPVTFRYPVTSENSVVPTSNSNNHDRGDTGGRCFIPFHSKRKQVVPKLELTSDNLVIEACTTAEGMKSLLSRSYSQKSSLATSTRGYEDFLSQNPEQLSTRQQKRNIFHIGSVDKQGALDF